MTTGLPTAAAGRWRAAGLALLTRLIAELAYEELLVPRAEPASPPRTPPPVGRGAPAPYRIECGPVTYTFTARRGTFGTWWPDPATLRRDGEPAWDPARFLLDTRQGLGWSGDVLTDVVREVTATQRADAEILRTALPARALADLSHLELEGHQTGHPCMIANKGRLGFDAADAARYAPESRRPFRLRWVAAHAELARLVTGPGLGATGLREAELSAATRAEFGAVLRAALEPTAGADAAALAERYVWLPVHPWQWENVVAPMFAGPLATGQLVDLGEAPDRYLPLQSVRTVANIDTPGRRDVKLALMIRNTLVWRGMSAADATAGPAVSAWLVSLAHGDPVLRATGVVVLPEIAGATVAHPAFDAVPDAPYRLHELLGVLWREPVASFLAPDERARTMACLLTVGADGESLAAELVRRSGLEPARWLAALLDALLPPLLHYLYVYGVAFTPHGENVICVFDAGGIPRRIAVKDFGADIDLVEGEFPERAATDGGAGALCRHWPGRMLAHSVLSAVFAGHFRYFSVIAADHLGVPEEEFWSLVRGAVEDYQEAHPEYAERFAAVDLLAPSFERVCLNREQFAGAGFHDRSGRDAQFDVLHGTVANPLVLAPPRRSHG
ncbi:MULTISPECIES: IucA/IucC family siderophore biosynthesis protein [unclassified Parafrankia]|uniref:IucA/IucC family protein n=1 Tax=unclassified Parafrankia TaxID=2994368 RepID=UPI000DA56F71|nr:MULTISPECIES: IucA/IucC family protein [unclassified Parafrankia]TCJ32509.1 IucA/IucC family protein [Parafrankia sp. BMG5.11]SQD97229.1 Siderophore synthetase, IucA/IucC family protein [Parafrankia sp. Ea1.12]